MLVCAGDATSSAVSTGGTASSTSLSQGSASVHTTTIAAQGGKAVAVQDAASGRHEVTKVAVGNYTATVQSHKPALSMTWEDAPACPFSATGEYRQTASILSVGAGTITAYACAGVHAAVLWFILTTSMQGDVDKLMVSVVHQSYTASSKQHALLPLVGTHAS
jgi:hypothetical protein